MSEHTSIPPLGRLLLRQREAAELLSISTRQLRKLTRRGEIPAIGCRRSLRYAVEDLRRWIEKHRSGGGKHHD